MNELSNKYAMAAMKQRRATIAGEIVATKSKLRHLKDALENIDATIRIFAPGFDPASVGAKRPRKRSKAFGAGDLSRLVLNALRGHGKPMATLDVIAAINAQLGFDEAAGHAMGHRARATLSYLSRVRGIVVKTGERSEARWHLRAV